MDAAVALNQRWIAGGLLPMRHIACFNLGTLLGALNRPADAEAAYRQAVGLQPDFPHARLNLGHLLERAGQTDSAHLAAGDDERQRRPGCNLMPPELEPYCTEKPIRRPHCYRVKGRRREVALRPDRAACGLPEDQFVVCSFNNNFKFTPEVFGTRMRIQGQVPGNVLCHRL